MQATTIPRREVLVFGTGAVGAVLGWRLAQNPSVRVSVVCRSNYEAIQKNGISLKTAIWGAGHFRPARVCRNASELRHVPFDYVVCANKATSSSAHGSIASVVREKTVLVSAQNGVGVEEPLQRSFPRQTILSGIVYVACTQPTPGVFYQNTSINARSLALGLFAKPACPEDHRARHSRLLDFASLESTFGVSEDIVKEKWIKQLWNGAFNTMAAISGMHTHQLLSSPKHLELVTKVMRETYQVAKASNVSLEDGIIETLLATTMSRAPVVPSMLQDALAGKPMEIESLCGDVCRLASFHGLKAPTLRAVYGTLLEMSARPYASVNTESTPLEMMAEARCSVLRA